MVSSFFAPGWCVVVPPPGSRPCRTASPPCCAPCWGARGRRTPACSGTCTPSWPRGGRGSPHWFWTLSPTDWTEAVLTGPRRFWLDPGGSDWTEAVLTGPRRFWLDPDGSDWTQTVLTGPRRFWLDPGCSNALQGADHRDSYSIAYFYFFFFCTSQEFISCDAVWDHSREVIVHLQIT